MQLVKSLGLGFPGFKSFPVAYKIDDFGQIKFSPQVLDLSIKW